MLCSKCGAELSEGVKFCDSCGEAVEEIQTEKPEIETAVPVIFNGPVVTKKKISLKAVMLPLTGLVAAASGLAFAFYPQMLSSLFPSEYAKYANANTERLIEQQREAASDSWGVGDFSGFNKYELSLSGLSMAGGGDVMLNGILSALSCGVTAIQNENGDQRGDVSLSLNGSDLSFSAFVNKDKVSVKLPGMDYAVATDFSELLGGDDAVQPILEALLSGDADIYALLNIDKKHFENRNYVNNGDAYVPGIDKPLTKLTTTVGGAEMIELAMEFLQSDLAAALLPESNELDAYNEMELSKDQLAAALEGMDISALPVIEYSIYVNGSHQTQAVSVIFSISGQMLDGGDIQCKVYAGFNGGDDMLDAGFVSALINAGDESCSLNITSSGSASDDGAYSETSSMSLRLPDGGGGSATVKTDVSAGGDYSVDISFGGDSLLLKGAIERGDDKVSLLLNEITYSAGGESIVIKMDAVLTLSKTDDDEIVWDYAEKSSEDISDEDNMAFQNEIEKWIDPVGLLPFFGITDQFILDGEISNFDTSGELDYSDFIGEHEADIEAFIEMYPEILDMLNA